MTNPLAMSAEEREAFLAGTHVAVFSVGRAEGQPPVTGPVWYVYEPGGDVVLSIAVDSQKEAALRANPTASLCVQTDQLPYRFVTVSGPVELAPGDDDVRRTIAARYLPADLVEGYLAGSGDPTAMVTVRLTPRTWYSNDFSRYM